MIALHIGPKQLCRLLGIWVAPSSDDGLPDRYYREPVADELPVLAFDVVSSCLLPSLRPLPRVASSTGRASGFGSDAS